MPYENIQEYGHRLRDSIVLYKGMPVYVRDISPVGNDGESGDFLHVTELPGFKKSYFVRTKDPNLNYKTFNFGYCNSKTHAIYITRMPVKKSKQGITKDCLSIPNLTDMNFDGMELTGSGGPIPTGVVYDKLIRTKAFTDMVTNNYPALGYAYEMLMTGTKGCAFHRNFALIRDPLELEVLLYKGERAASIAKFPYFKVPKAKYWLRETMEEAGMRLL